MTLSAFEAAVNQRNTKAFVDADPTWLTLITSTEVWHGGSKRMVDGAARTPQPFKIIYQGGDQIVTTSDGTTKKLDFVLVGYHNASVAVGDHWKEGKQTYQITEIEPWNGYEVKAKGITIGGNPSHG